jgi:hypothetical protein
MIKFTLKELEELSQTAEETMQDSCIVGLRSVTFDSLGDEIETWSGGAEIFCGIDLNTSNKVYGDLFNETKFDGIFRLPVGTTVEDDSKITVTKRFGVTCSGIGYKVNTPVISGASCILLGALLVEV